MTEEVASNDQLVPDVGTPVGSSFQEVMRDPSKRGAELREDWRRSSERRTLLLATSLIFIAVVTITAAAILWANATAPSYEEEGIRQAFAGLAAFVSSAYIGLLLFFLIRRQQHRAWYDRAVVLKAGLALQQAETQAGGRDLDLGSLWELTHKRLDYYHKIAMSQSEKSFTYGVVAAGIGFFVLVVAVVVAAVSGSTATSVAAGIIGIAGSALSGYLGATFIRLHESSTAQLRAYFAQPLEFSRYLAAERLLAPLKRRAREPAIRLLAEALASGRASSGESSMNKDKPGT